MENANPINIVTFYLFKDLDAAGVSTLEAAILEKCKELDILGLFIIGPEGINTTFSGAEKNTKALKLFFSEYFKMPLTFKDSWGPKHPFLELTVKIRPEIVTLERPDVRPKDKHRHLSPEEWDRELANGAICIDTRNDYEFKIGRFKNAVNPNTRKFTQFRDFLKNTPYDKDQKILIYCTGGIRCEKGIYEMESQGFKNVYQLDGGILNYLAKKPNSNFEGECFVFDYRVAVDQELKPTQTYRLCPHCGQPGKTLIHCRMCKTPEIVCDHCLLKSFDMETCSKSCAHHAREGHKSKKPHRNEKTKRQSLVRSPIEAP